ncbi:porin family protein [Dyadobacter luticola]|uniref:Porin family protein n=1 Tax=Dyadobacter luticola TaxID=1979387 RepID=A0A5R9KYM9_9BACT|nr:porin family protein [Dyadobacter luticola]TLV01219.1 porin family protein [Dyadobacter luticola]
MKTITLATLFLFIFISAHAQDVLVKRNGDTIEGKVIEVGIDRVSYKISKEPNAAVFVIRKNELSRIEFENGQTVLLNDRLNLGRKQISKPSNNEVYGRSQLNFSPFKALDSGPGFGISYEIQVDKNQYIGIILPLTMTFPDRYNYLFDSNGNRSEMYYVSPGLKIYPFSQHRVTYAVGPQLFLGYGKGYSNNSIYDPTTGGYIPRTGTTKNFRLGILVNNYVNFQITPKFQLGLNGGLGSRYVDREKNEFDSITNRGGINITGEFNFSLGFRF